MPYRDIREFVDRLEAEGELKRIKTEVDWNLEIGAITRRDMDLRGPALLFENISGYPRGFSVLGNIFTATKPVIQGRYSLAIDLPKDTPALKIIEEFEKRVSKPMRPKIVADGPCKENILKGDQVDLFKFPTPLIHYRDGGRYIGTWHIDVTRDPDSEWTNWGMYRHMIHDKKTMGILPCTGSDGFIQLEKYERSNKDMPFAMAIGTEPVSSIVAGTPFSHPPEEADFAGALRGQPVELVKCETVDLYVPSTSEIVIEGIIKPHERKLEGPFGEYTGYDAGGVAERPVVHVTCVTHRDKPILTMSNMGKLWDEDAVLNSIGRSASLSIELKKREFSFRSVYVRPPTVVIISAKPAFAGYSHTLASAIWSTKVALTASYIIVVGDDVDVTDMEDVFWCLTTRMHPVNGITVESGTPSHALISFLTPDERGEDSPGHRALFDAIFPKEWPLEKVPRIIDFEHAWPDDIRERVLRKWKQYGLE